MDRLVGPVNLQIMARLVRKLFGGDLPNEVARMIHQMIQRWVNYMNHYRRALLRGVYNGQRPFNVTQGSGEFEPYFYADDQTVAFPPNIRTTEPFRYFDRDNDEMRSTDPGLEGSNSWRLLLPLRGWSAHMSLPWRMRVPVTDPLGRIQQLRRWSHDEMGINAVLQPRFYGPGF